MEFSLPSLSRAQVLHNFLYENNWLVHRAVSQMDAVYTIGRDLVPKVKSMYRLRCEPSFLPTPVAVPDHIEKAERPTVCYMARLDRRKRPRLFLDLARQFPHVRFIIAGKSRNAGWETTLRRDYGGLPNVEFAGFVDQFNDPRHGAILGQSWVLVNTATREALPNSFIEAMANGCAILSQVNPDDFASRFGHHARNGNFAEGLAWLLAADRWRTQGAQGRAHMRDTFEITKAMDQHEAAYHRAVRD
jgi:glycosyltransferase involved in cell wall biosynthesis